MYIVILSVVQQQVTAGVVRKHHYHHNHHHHHHCRLYSPGWVLASSSKCRQRPLSCASLSALQPWVSLGLLKQMSPATSILWIRPPISTTQFHCFFIHPVNPSWFRLAKFSLTSPGFAHNIFLGSSFVIHSYYMARPTHSTGFYYFN